jgi:hypothetical protein
LDAEIIKSMLLPGHRHIVSNGKDTIVTLQVLVLVYGVEGNENKGRDDTKNANSAPTA